MLYESKRMFGILSYDMSIFNHWVFNFWIIDYKIRSIRNISSL